MKSLEGTFFASYHTSDSDDRSRNSSDNISFTPSLLLILLFSQYFHNEIMLRCYTCLQSLIVSNPWLFHSNETVDLHRELFHSNPWLGSNCAQHEPPWTILLPATSNTIITSTTGCIIFTQSPHSILTSWYIHSSGVNQGTIPLRVTGRVKLFSTTGCIIFTQSPHSILTSWHIHSSGVNQGTIPLAITGHVIVAITLVLHHHYY